ncbi:MAG: outer membrane lipoprotein carrier protein LolA [Acidobacteriota bacterium]|jgi:outer membrane lipoprotein carrier protein
MRMVTRPDVAGAIVAACLMALPQQEAPAPGIDLLVGRIQERYENASLQAHFVINRLSRLGSVMNSEEGEVYIHTPGRMRWEYTSTEMLMVAGGDGRETYLYLPRDNQVQVMQADASNPREYPFLYLSGRGNLRRDFDIQRVEWGNPLSRDNVQLELRPRRGETSFQRLILEVEPVRATIVRLVNFDNLNNTIEYQFHNVEYDVDLPDELFEFKIPEGADVLMVGG